MHRKYKNYTFDEKFDSYNGVFVYFEVNNQKWF